MRAYHVLFVVFIYLSNMMPIRVSGIQQCRQDDVILARIDLCSIVVTNTELYNISEAFSAPGFHTDPKEDSFSLFHWSGLLVFQRQSEQWRARQAQTRMASACFTEVDCLCSEGSLSNGVPDRPRQGWLQPVLLNCTICVPGAFQAAVLHTEPDKDGFSLVLCD